MYKIVLIIMLSTTSISLYGMKEITSVVPHVLNQIKYPPLTLNVLLNRNCNYRCSFCIEKTQENVQNERTPKEIIADINKLIDAKCVSDVLLLGGEPLFYKGLLDVCNKIKIKPIITTNGYRLVKDKNFRKKFLSLDLKALNISVPDYNEEKRNKLMGCKGFSNEEFFIAIDEIKKAQKYPIRINTMLVKGDIDSLYEIKKMINFAQIAGVQEIAFKELTGRDPLLHDFIEDSVLDFNKKHYVKIKEIWEEIKGKEGVVLWKTLPNLKIFYASSPERFFNVLKSDGCPDMNKLNVLTKQLRKQAVLDPNGIPWHRVLFNDGQIGYSWRRDDGITGVDEMIANEMNTIIKE